MTRLKFEGRMKKRVRYPILKFCMVVGIVITYFSFVFAGRMVREEYLQNSDLENYQRQEDTMSVLLRYEKDGADILHAMDGEDVTAYLSLVPLYVDAEETPCLMNVYLHLPESFPFHVEEGNVPTKEALAGSMPGIVLGRGLKDDVIHREDGDYYKICGEEYRVIAYVSSEESDSLDSVRILFYDCLGEKAKEDIDYIARTMGLTLLLRSGNVDLTEYYNEKQQLVEDRVDQISYSREIVEDSYSVDNSLVDYQKFAYLIYIFGIVLIVMVMELWIVQRKKEFAIRRAVGYTRYQIIGMISLEMIKTIGGIGIALFLIQHGVQAFFSSSVKFDWSNDIALCMAFMVVTFVLLMFYPIYKIMTDSMAASIQDKGV